MLEGYSSMKRNFLTLWDLTPEELKSLIKRAVYLKKERHLPKTSGLAASRSMVLIFEKSSTRTRISFEVAWAQLGGNSVFLAPNDSQMSRGESLSDTARIVSSMADLIVMRTGAHSRVKTMATHSKVPVINALTDTFHPCQLLADLQTFYEHRGNIEGASVTFIGDGSSNVCHSWINASAMMNFSLRIGAPEGYYPNDDVYSESGKNCTVFSDPMEAAFDADLIITDTWTGMGQENEKKSRSEIFENFQVDEKIMRNANNDAIFMHCLPAYRGQEVAAEVIDGPQSVVWEEAENRLHAQKALIELLFD